MYRILTEAKNPDTVAKILQSQVSGYTILSGKGFWRGADRWYSEDSIVIELAEATKAQAEKLAAALKTANNQESVLLQSLPIESEFI